MLEALESGPAKDRAPRLQSLADSFDGRPRPERKPAEVKLGQAEVRHEFAQVAGQDPNRIMLRLVGLGAEAVGAEVWHDHPKPLRRDPLGVAEPDPVDVRVGEEAVEQDHRAPGAKFVECELDAVGS